MQRVSHSMTEGLAQRGWVVLGWSRSKYGGAGPAVCLLCSQFTFLQDDIGIPKNYRHMEGFGVHTFTLINKAGKVTYVKFHWQPSCGTPRCRICWSIVTCLCSMPMW